MSPLPVSPALPPSGPSAALAQHAEEELLRAPLLWERLLDGLTPATPWTTGNGPDELTQLLKQHGARLGTEFVDLLQRHVLGTLSPAPAAPPPARDRGRVRLELVNDDVIALDIELSRTVQAIEAAAEEELRGLQSYLAAMVGDFFVAEDHNPLPPAVYARALRATAQQLSPALPQRLRYIRAATPLLAQLVQQSYSSACDRLAAQGLEPATHGSVISQEDHRWRVVPAPASMPDLRRMRDAMPPNPRGLVARAPGAAGDWSQELRDCRAEELQSIQLVKYLFDAFRLDERVPVDVGELLELLREPAMRLTLRDPLVLDRLEHPLWRLMHLFAYQAEMVPRVHDAERQRWLGLGRRIFDRLAAAPMPKSAAYRDAVARLEAFLRECLAQRVAVLSSRLDALQRTEKGLAALGTDAQAEGPELDTVPAALMPRAGSEEPLGDEAGRAAALWYDELVPGQWLRLLLNGAWVHAQLLWLGDERQILLLGDAASKTTWALRRSLLQKMHRHALAKTLTMRSLVGTAALRVQERLAIAVAA